MAISPKILNAARRRFIFFSSGVTVGVVILIEHFVKRSKPPILRSIDPHLLSFFINAGLHLYCISLKTNLKSYTISALRVST